MSTFEPDDRPDVVLATVLVFFIFIGFILAFLR